MSSDRPLASTAKQAFDILFEEIKKHCDDLKIQSAEASLLGQFTKVRCLAERYNDWLGYQKKLEKLQSQWTKLSHLPKLESKKTGSEPDTNLKKEGKLLVTLHGQNISKDNNTETFVATLSEIGLEQVALLDKKIDHVPLLELMNNPDSDPLSNPHWQIHTDFDDVKKCKILQFIAKRLDIDMIVTLQ